jgi:hypothetical protein
MRKKYLVEIRVRDCQSDRFIVDFCQYRDTLLESALDMIEARGKIEMSHLFDMMAESMASSYRKGVNHESEIEKRKGESA